MSEEEIINRMIVVNPSEIIYSINMQQVLTALVRRKGIEALALTEEDLLLAMEEVKIAINHFKIHISSYFTNHLIRPYRIKLTCKTLIIIYCIGRANFLC